MWMLIEFIVIIIVFCIEVDEMESKGFRYLKRVWVELIFLVVVDFF